MILKPRGDKGLLHHLARRALHPDRDLFKYTQDARSRRVFVKIGIALGNSLMIVIESWTLPLSRSC
jgi:hypothetical protein